jgi:hypothetical protein
MQGGPENGAISGPNWRLSSWFHVKQSAYHAYKIRFKMVGCHPCDS